MILLKDSVVFLLEPMVPLKAVEFLLEVVIQLERIELSCGPHDSIGIFQIFMEPVIQSKTIKFLRELLFNYSIELVHYSNRPYDFYGTIPRCYSDVYVDHFFLTQLGSGINCL